MDCAAVNITLKSGFGKVIQGSARLAAQQAARCSNFRPLSPRALPRLKFFKADLKVPLPILEGRSLSNRSGEQDSFPSLEMLLLHFLHSGLISISQLVDVKMERLALLVFQPTVSRYLTVLASGCAFVEKSVARGAQQMMRHISPLSYAIDLRTSVSY